MARFVLRKSVGPLSSGTRVTIVGTPTGGTVKVMLEAVSDKLREQLKKKEELKQYIGEFEVDSDLVVQLKGYEVYRRVDLSS